MAKLETVKIEFRGEEVEIPKADETWFKAKIKAEKEANTKKNKK